MNARSNDTSTLLLAALLAGISTLGPFSIDTYMPSFPAIERAFAVTPIAMQQTISAYMIPFSVMTLFHGALSDSFGRRPVIVFSLGMFGVASFGCSLSQNITQMLVFRGMQGMFAGAGMVVGRAMIRDVYHGHEAQRVMSLVTMIFGLAPAIAPILGGWLEIWFGWRSVFAFLVLFAGALCFASYRRLPETLAVAKRQRFAPRPLLRAYLRLLGAGRFLLLTSSVAFNFAAFFLYISSAPALIYNLLGLDAHQFGYLFVPGVTGIVIGAFISGRLAGRLSARRTVGLAYGVMIGAVAFNLGYHALWPPALPWTVAAVMLYNVGMSLAMPNLTLLALDLFPENRGLAASLQGGQQSLFTGLTAGILSPWLSVSALGLAAGTTGLMACGLVCWFAYSRLPKRESLHA